MALLLLLVLLPFNIQASENFILTDPYTKSIAKPTHEIQIRLFQHGLKGQEKLIAEQLRHTETIFAQCPGIAVKITPLEYQALKSSTTQEKMTDFKGSKSYFTKDFLKFVTPFSNQRQSEVIDVHMTEYMNTEIRKTKKLNGATTYGQAFNPTLLNVYFNDPRPLHQQNPSLADLAGNRVFMAIGTVALQRNSFLKYPQMISKPRSYSLMAHELGHLIFENYNPDTGFYGDHWCPEAETHCEKGYLMSTGGNNDAYYTSLDGSKIIGFDPLPKLDSIQCEKLRTSKYVRKL